MASKKTGYELNGIRVVEAKTAIEITPSPQDIKKGKRSDPAACAFRRDPKVQEVRVHRSRTYIKFKGREEWVRYKTPVRLALETVVFDRGGKFVRDKFVFPVLQPTQQVANRKNLKRYKFKKGAGTKRLTRIAALPGVRDSAHLTRASA